MFQQASQSVERLFICSHTVCLSPIFTIQRVKVIITVFIEIRAGNFLGTQQHPALSNYSETVPDIILIKERKKRTTSLSSPDSYVLNQNISVSLLCAEV